MEDGHHLRLNFGAEILRSTPDQSIPTFYDGREMGTWTTELGEIWLSPCFCFEFGVIAIVTVPDSGERTNIGELM